MDKGWISIHRKMQEHWLWSEKRTFSNLEAWLDILMTVNHTEKKVLLGGLLLNVERGQSILSLDSWGKRWKWNKSKVRRFFVLLESDGMITTKNEVKTTRLTVCKYDSYQENGNANETQTKRNRNANETQPTPNNNVNKDNNVNNIKRVKNEFKNSISPFLEVYTSDLLNSFYSYWTEHGENDKKVRYQKEKSFSISRRLKTWVKREQEFKQNPKAGLKKFNGGEGDWTNPYEKQ